MPKPEVALTEAEWTIIKAVWANEPCAAPAIQEKLFKQTAWTYSTVRTLMDRMVAKGLLSAEKVRNLTLYRSAVTRQQAQRGELLYALKHAFNGALTPMIQYLIESNELSAEDLAELETLIKARKRGGKEMNSFIEHLNVWGERALQFAWPMLWQSSLLIVLIFALDYALRGKVRAAIRYGLWLIVLVKLVVPPSLALPTGLAWWLRQPAPAPAPAAVTLQPTPLENIVVADANLPRPALPLPQPAVRLTAQSPPPISISGQVWALGAWALISFGLFVWLGVRWRQVAKYAGGVGPMPVLGTSASLNLLLEGARRLAGVRRAVPCRLIDRPVSPAVCGLFRPVVLLPRSLAEQLPTAQLRAILLHELIHLRRRDVWVNCLQALLQIIYWWHPLLWLANARIRRLREEAVDDAVMLALADESDAYAPTLLEVAKLSFSRPLTALGLVGILESRRGLRQRIERLMNFKTPRRAGVSVVSLLFIAAVTALAVPMGEAPTQLAAAATPGDRSVAASGSPEAEPFDPPTKPGTNSGNADLRTQGALVASNSVTETMELFADSMDFDAASHTMIAKGNVRIVKEGATLRAIQIVSTAPGELRTVESKPGAIELPAIVFGIDDNGALSLGTNALSFTNAQSVFQMARELMLGTPGDLSVWIEATRESPWRSVVQLVDLARQMNFPDIRMNTIPTNRTPATAGALHSGVNDSFRGHFGPQPTDNFLLRIAQLKKAEDQTPKLFIRMFKVDPNTFLMGLQSAGVQLTTSTPLGETKIAINSAIKQFFKNLGVDLELPKSIFFNDRGGSLLVRATLQDLDIIEVAVQSLNAAPPQVTVKVKFAEIGSDGANPGFDRYLELLLTNSIGGRAFATNSTYGTASSADALTGILTDPQYRELLRNMEDKSKVSLLFNDGSVTTLSGRQAQLQVVELKYVATNINPQALKPPGVRSSDEVVQTLALPCGPVLDVIPVVNADGYTVHLNITASLTEFLGYEDSGKTNLVTVYIDGKKRQIATPRPKFRIRQLTTQAIVWDGQTVVLSGLIADQPTPAKGAASARNAPVKKSLIVFVTPTIIDAAGNRLHPDNEEAQAPRTLPSRY